MRPSSLAFALLLGLTSWACSGSEPAAHEGASSAATGSSGTGIGPHAAHHQGASTARAHEGQTGAAGTLEGDTPADVVAPNADPRFRCVMPALPIPRPSECATGSGYPECKWQLPSAIYSEHSWRRWRNTIPAHQYARPALVALLVTTAHEMHRLAPEQPFVIGDLDAPGPRHSTHDHGVDVDLYLPGTLMVENSGGGSYDDNFAGKSPEEVEQLRARALLLAEILATCSQGQLRIYYNDELVRTRFLRWFAERGYHSPFAAPMMGHNHLHDFHFHVSVSEDLPLLPSEPYREPPPVEPIEAPPTEEEIAASNALSSRSASPPRATDGATPGQDETPSPPQPAPTADPGREPATAAPVPAPAQGENPAPGG